MPKEGLLKGASERYIHALLLNTTISVLVISVLVSFYFDEVPKSVNKTHVSEGMNVVTRIKSNLSVSYFQKGAWPKASVFDIERENFQVIKSISFDGIGTININYNDKVPSLKGKTLSFTVAKIPEIDNSNLIWVCGYADVPTYFKLIGKNMTTINSQFLPSACKKNQYKTDINKGY